MPDMRVSGSSGYYGISQSSNKDPSRLKSVDGKTEEKSELTRTPGTKEVTPEERSSIQELVIIEKKVIAHEQAHKAAGGEFTGPASYSYSVGPDGKRYVTGGEVSIKIPSTDDKEAMLNILERVKQAALAPADPSGQDIRVAASVSSKQASIRSEIMKEKAAKAYQGVSKEAGSPENNGKNGHFDQKI